MKSLDWPRPTLKHVLLLNLIGWLLMLLLLLLAPHIAAAQPLDTPQAPPATYQVYLPLISRPASRIGPITPLSASVPRYGKFEIAFAITTTATNLYFPHDPAAPYNERGVTVDLLITNPAGSEKTVPCFYYQPVDANLTPVGQPDWRCRYSPETIGVWRYRVRLIDAIGPAESAGQSFTVTSSNSRGFVRVSPTDSHYFEFDDGTPFLAPLINVEWGNPLSNLNLIRANIPKWGANGVRFVRWLPTGEGANAVTPYGDDERISWQFGDGWTRPENPDAGKLFSYEPYFYSHQYVSAAPGASYRLTFRARVEGQRVLRVSLGAVSGAAVSIDICGSGSTYHQAQGGTCTVQRAGWYTYTLRYTNTSAALLEVAPSGLYVSADAPAPYDSVQAGQVAVGNMQLQRAAGGGWGPNLLARSDPDTFLYVDQVEAAKLDEVLRLSELAGVYHKLALFHKNDLLSSKILPDGTTAAADDFDRFYAGPGSANRRHELAYARYFAARWSYSTALHSVELANENMLSDISYETAFSVLAAFRQAASRPVLISNSFWGYFVVPFWTDPRASLMDYADKHWYARPTGDGELVSNLYTDSAGNVRQCQRRFAEYRAEFAQNKPIVRGETGVWPVGDDNNMDLGAGAPTYYHKQLWAQMGDQCGGEWYTDYLDDHNLWGEYLRYEQFLQGEPLTNGRYADIGSDTGAIKITNSAGAARAWGKLDAVAGRGLIWIDNANDTWQRVANGQSVTPASASVEINGVPNGSYQVTWFNTATGATTTAAQTAANGKLTLSVSALAHDVAVKIKKQ
jgi:hypothetical protein